MVWVEVVVVVVGWVAGQGGLCSPIFRSPNRLCTHEEERCAEKQQPEVIRFPIRERVLL